MPDRYISFLRHVHLYKLLTGNKRKGYKILDLQSAINCLAARNTIRRLSITLEEWGKKEKSEWDLDRFSILHALDDGKCISTAVVKLMNLGRLEIQKIQEFCEKPEPIRAPSEWMAGLWNRVKVEYFAKAKAVGYRSQAEQEKDRNYYSVTEEFLD